MALLHVHATISPTKSEVVMLWLRSQDWFTRDLTDLEMLGSYRFDDPAGEVGLEVMLARLADGTVVQVPLTYRGTQLLGGDPICVMSHSVLGDRWVYPGTSDPVFLTAISDAIRSGADQAPLQFEEDGQLQTREPVVTARGSGDGDESLGDMETLSVPHLLDPSADLDGLVLAGRYPGVDADVLLARLG